MTAGGWYHTQWWKPLSYKSGISLKPHQQIYHASHFTSHNHTQLKSYNHANNQFTTAAKDKQHSNSVNTWIMDHDIYMNALWGCRHPPLKTVSAASVTNNNTQSYRHSSTRQHACMQVHWFYIIPDSFCRMQFVVALSKSQHVGRAHHRSCSPPPDARCLSYPVALKLARRNTYTGHLFDAQRSSRSLHTSISITSITEKLYLYVRIRAHTVQWIRLAVLYSTTRTSLSTVVRFSSKASVQVNRSHGTESPSIEKRKLA